MERRVEGQEGGIDGEIVLKLDRGPTSVPVARRAVQRWLVERHVPEAVVDRARLVVTELADNAVRHAGTSFTVRVAVEGDRVVLEVADGDGRLPVVRRPNPAALSGRGLWLVSRLADRWGVEPRPDGKVVWARLLGEDRRRGAAARERQPRRGDDLLGSDDVGCRHLAGDHRRA